MRPYVDKLEKIRQIEYDLDRIRGLVERVDERANGVMYASGALALFYVGLLTLITELDIDLVANNSVFVVFLFFSSICSMSAFLFSIVSIYPIPFNVVPPETFLFCWDNVPGEDWNRLQSYLRDDLNLGWVKNPKIQKNGDKIIRISNNENSDEITIKKKKKKAILKIRDGRTQTHKLKVKKENDTLNIYGRTKGKNGKTTLENFKEGDGTSSKSKILEFRDGTKWEITFEPILKIEKPDPIYSAKSCQKMNVDKIMYFKCATLHGQKLAIVRKYSLLRWALISLTLSVVFLFCSFLWPTAEFILSLVCYYSGVTLT